MIKYICYSFIIIIFFYSIEYRIQSASLYNKFEMYDWKTYPLQMQAFLTTYKSHYDILLIGNEKRIGNNVETNKKLKEYKDISWLGRVALWIFCGKNHGAKKKEGDTAYYECTIIPNNLFLKSFWLGLIFSLIICGLIYRNEKSQVAQVKAALRAGFSSGINYLAENYNLNQKDALDGVEPAPGYENPVITDAEISRAKTVILKGAFTSFQKKIKALSTILMGRPSLQSFRNIFSSQSMSDPESRAFFNNLDELMRSNPELVTDAYNNRRAPLIRDCLNKDWEKNSKSQKNIVPREPYSEIYSSDYQLFFHLLLNPHKEILLVFGVGPIIEYGVGRKFQSLLWLYWSIKNKDPANLVRMEQLFQYLVNEIKIHSYAKFLLLSLSEKSVRINDVQPYSMLIEDHGCRINYEIFSLPDRFVKKPQFIRINKESLIQNYKHESRDILEYGFSSVETLVMIMFTANFEKYSGRDKLVDTFRSTLDKLFDHEGFQFIGSPDEIQKMVIEDLDRQFYPVHVPGARLNSNQILDDRGNILLTVIVLNSETMQGIS